MGGWGGHILYQIPKVNFYAKSISCFLQQLVCTYRSAGYDEIDFFPAPSLPPQYLPLSNSELHILQPHVRVRHPPPDQFSSVEKYFDEYALLTGIHTRAYTSSMVGSNVPSDRSE